jgi:hypothetical protein
MVDIPLLVETEGDRVAGILLVGMHDGQALAPCIVEYSDVARPVNLFPTRIVSPTRPRACCDASMIPAGEQLETGRAQYRYMRCGVCGYTVRKILAVRACPAVLAGAKKALANSFRRPGECEGP